MPDVSANILTLRECARQLGVPVASVNQTGEAMFGRPYIVTTQYGVVVAEPGVPVATGNSSAVVNLAAFTSALPSA